MSTSKLVPVILSGGSGSRLWPVSRKNYPKPFIDLPDGDCLLQKTYQRAGQLAGVETILTVTNRDYYFMSHDVLTQCNLQQKDTPFLLESVARNTAPAIAMAARVIADRLGDDAVLLILPSDHLIKNIAVFNDVVAKAHALANENKLVTFGITPDRPETGYGYIHFDASTVDHGFDVLKFVEKPDLATAEKYLSDGCYLWNSGMFCFSAATILKAFQSLAPEVVDIGEDCWLTFCEKNPQYTDVDLQHTEFEKMPDISIDYAIMEKAKNVKTISSDIGWNDIGSWTSLEELLEADENGNRVDAENILFDVKNTLIKSDKRLVAGIGLDNLMIIDTPDALLIADKSHAQDVKKIVDSLKQDDHEAHAFHTTVTRPWGTYTTLEEGLRFKIKRIVVKPGAALSLQMHHHRSEHWIVVSGTAKVVNAEKEYFVHPNESTYIPIANHHKLTNPGKVDLILIEVQCGDYLGEDDIVRFGDIYGRS